MDHTAVQDQYSILATSARADERTRVLKQGETFGVFDRYGDVHNLGAGESGLYFEGTRFLSKFELRIAGDRPLFLSSMIRKADALLTVDLTTPDTPTESGVLLPKGVLHLFRRKFLWAGTCYERLTLTNYGLTRVRTFLAVHLDADFADVFEVRGTVRPRRGQKLDPQVTGSRLTLGYRGLDEVMRQTTIRCEPAPTQASGSRLVWPIDLDPGASMQVHMEVSCYIGDGPRESPLSFDDAFSTAVRALTTHHERHALVTTSNGEFNEWVSRSLSDLAMMVTDLADGPYPYAGIPWFSAPFGRDGLITAMESLWIDPDISKGVLRYLASTQATKIDRARDAEPGKILHEARQGEMAALGEVPFSRYYGSVDATPLFVMLAGAHFVRTGDRAVAEELWPHVDLALSWIDEYGDVDHDGFVEYARQNPTGLINQGWKDSHDAVFDEQGLVPEGPIALCEVQGYVYAAKRAASQLAWHLGWSARAAALTESADLLQRNFERAFWCPDLGTYALALDGHKRPCRVRTSNAGQALFTGIVSADHARRLVRLLASDDMYSGWGVRTVAVGEPRFNPMAYHNGSIWPHDNAIIGMGCARYGFKDVALRILSDLFDAVHFLDLRRLPELFCGFPRRHGEGPTLYPIACLPQAWAAASVFLLLQAALGLEIDGRTRTVTFSHPELPEWLTEVRLEKLVVGDGEIDLLCQRHPHDVGISVLKRRGDITVVHVT